MPARTSDPDLGPRHVTTITVRVTRPQRQAIEAEAARASVSSSVWLRRVGLYVAEGRAARRAGRPVDGTA